LSNAFFLPLFLQSYFRDDVDDGEDEPALHIITDEAAAQRAPSTVYLVFCS